MTRCTGTNAKVEISLALQYDEHHIKLMGNCSTAVVTNTETRTATNWHHEFCMVTDYVRARRFAMTMKTAIISCG